MEKLTKSGMVRSSLRRLSSRLSLPHLNLPTLFYHAVCRVLSKCGLHVLGDMLGCFALKTKVADDRTMLNFVTFFHFQGLEKSDHFSEKDIEFYMCQQLITIQ